ncbi:hypothetical protein ABVT39_006696 [Epinephelus coioides]
MCAVSCALQTPRTDSHSTPRALVGLRLDPALKLALVALIGQNAGDPPTLSACCLDNEEVDEL